MDELTHQYRGDQLAIMQSLLTLYEQSPDIHSPQGIGMACQYSDAEAQLERAGILRIDGAAIFFTDRGAEEAAALVKQERLHFDPAFGRTEEPELPKIERYRVADFVAETERVGIIVEGLPDGVSAEQAAEVFKSMDSVLIGPGNPGDNWYTGWFPKEVETVEGEHLFTVSRGTIDDPRLKLHIQPDAEKYLKL